MTSVPCSKCSGMARIRKGDLVSPDSAPDDPGHTAGNASNVLEATPTRIGILCPAGHYGALMVSG